MYKYPRRSLFQNSSGEAAVWVGIQQLLASWSYLLSWLRCGLHCADLLRTCNLFPNRPTLHFKEKVLRKGNRGVVFDSDQLRYIYFRTDSIGKDMNRFILSTKYLWLKFQDRLVWSDVVANSSRKRKLWIQKSA